jgi:hypothetical protein
MTNSQSLRVWRFLAIAFFATFVVFGLNFLVFSFPDTRPPTHFENIWTYIWIVFSWPLVVLCSIFHNGGDDLVFYILGWIGSGLFWAFIVELIFKLKSKTGKISNQSK